MDFPELTTLLYVEVCVTKELSAKAGTRRSVSDLWSRSGREV